MALSRKGTDSLARALQISSGQPVTVLYNDGDAIIHDTYNCNVAIYNAPGSTVTFVGSAKCSSCNKTFSSEAEKEQHYRDYPKTCREHNHCFAYWSNHVDQYSHTMCPISGCAKSSVNFGSNVRFRQHFRNKH